MEKNNASMLPKIAFLAALLLCAMVPSMAESSATTDSKELLFERKIKMPRAKSEAVEAEIMHAPKVIVEEWYTGKADDMIKNAANGEMTTPAQPLFLVVKKYLMKDEETLKCGTAGSPCNPVFGPASCCDGHFCIAFTLSGGVCT